MKGRAEKGLNQLSIRRADIIDELAYKILADLDSAQARRTTCLPTVSSTNLYEYPLASIHLIPTRTSPSGARVVFHDDKRGL